MLSTSLLGALRCFEIAARHRNFTRASEEMHVTTGAVSHQIRTLEARLGRTLFTRLPRGLALTQDGQTLLAMIAPALTTIESAIQRFSTADAPLRVSCSPSFAMLWLMPRMGDFYANHPGIQIQLRAEFQDLPSANMVAEGMDIVIRYRPQADPESERILMPEYLVPMAKAGLLPKADAESWPEGTALLLDAAAWDGAERDAEWKSWFAGTGHRRAPGWIDQDFSLFALAFNAAQHGQGVCMGRLGLARTEIEHKSVMLASTRVLRSPAQYWLCVAPVASAQAEAFARWLQFRCMEYHQELETYISLISTVEMR